MSVVLITRPSSRHIRRRDHLTLYLGLGVAARGDVRRFMSTRQMRLLVSLLVAKRYVSCHEIDDALYGEDPDGGPDYIESARGKNLARLRRLGAELGFSIHNERGRGYAARLLGIDMGDAA